MTGIIEQHLESIVKEMRELNKLLQEIVKALKEKSND